MDFRKKMQHKQKIRFVFCTFLILILSGCAIPGAHLNIGDKEVKGEADDEVLEAVEVYPITASLIRNLRSSDDKGPQNNPVLEKELAGYQYRIGRGDVLNITVWDHPELTIPAGQFRSSSESGNWVSNEGNIFYPYIGKLSVVGKTLDEVRDSIANRLSKYIEKPQVDVNIAAFRAHRVFVTGEVKKPGNVPVTNIPLTLLDAVNMAEGLTEKSDWRRVTLHRNGQDELISMRNLLQHGDMSENRLLLSGDIVHVASIDDSKVYVMGSVKKAGTLPISRNGLSLTEALSNVGGLNESESDATGVFVIRRAPQGSEKVANIYQLDLADATAMVFGVDFPLQSNDVVYVTTAPISRWARVVNQIFPTILTVDIIDRLGDGN